MVAVSLLTISSNGLDEIRLHGAFLLSRQDCALARSIDRPRCPAVRKAWPIVPCDGEAKVGHRADTGIPAPGPGGRGGPEGAAGAEAAEVPRRDEGGSRRRQP